MRHGVAPGFLTLGAAAFLGVAFFLGAAALGFLGAAAFLGLAAAAFLGLAAAFLGFSPGASNRMH
jgi:hypothetical protein